MRTKRCLLQAALLVLTLGATDAAAQTYEFDPRQWFPLEVGNEWRYDLGARIVAERDTLVDTNRWIYLRNTPHSWLVDAWYRYTEEHYLLKTITFADVDTLWRTYPRSLFTINVPYDSTLRSPNAIEGSTRRTGFADLYILDSTAGSPEGVMHEPLFSRYALFSDRGFGFAEEFEVFEYGIGLAEACCDLLPFRLEGALVGGKRYGTLRTSSEDEEPRHPALRVSVYPNPAARRTHIIIDVDEPGLYTVEVYNLIGQRLSSTAVRMQPKMVWQTQWPEQAGSTPAGSYLVRVLSDGALAGTGRFVVVR